MKKLIVLAGILGVTLIIASTAVADERWDEYISNGQSVGNTSTAFIFNFKASVVIVTNSGAQSCHVRFKSGDATTADKIVRAGAQADLRYSGSDIGNGAGVPRIAVICPSTSSVDVWAIRPY